TFTGGVTLTAGTLNINSTAALGTTAGSLTILGGTIDNTSGTAVTAANPEVWGANFTFQGSTPLSITGAVGISSSDRTVMVNSPGLGVNFNALTVGAALSGNFSLTKTGPGLLSLT